MTLNKAHDKGELIYPQTADVHKIQFSLGTL